MKRIMLIDDEVPLTRIMQMTIESTDEYLVTIVNDPKDALYMANEIHPDLILLDVIMPGMNGIQVAEQLRADPDLEGIPIAFLSATVVTMDGQPLVDIGDGTFKKLDNEILRTLPVLEKPLSDVGLFKAIETYVRR